MKESAESVDGESIGGELSITAGVADVHHDDSSFADNKEQAIGLGREAVSHDFAGVRAFGRDRVRGRKEGQIVERLGNSRYEPVRVSWRVVGDVIADVGQFLLGGS